MKQIYNKIVNKHDDNEKIERDTKDDKFNFIISKIFEKMSEYFTEKDKDKNMPNYIKKVKMSFIVLFQMGL